MSLLRDSDFFFPPLPTFPFAPTHQLLLLPSTATAHMTMMYTLLSTNIHCPSCVSTINSILTNQFNLTNISISILTGLINFTSNTTVTSVDSDTLLRSVRQALIENGFDIVQSDPKDSTSTQSFDLPSTSFNSTSLQSQQPKTKWYELNSTRIKREQEEEKERQKRYEVHLLSCLACQSSSIEDDSLSKGKGKDHIIQFNLSPSPTGEFKTTLLVTGMTCSSCVSSVQSILSTSRDERIKAVNVTLLTGETIVQHEESLSLEELKEKVEEGGFGVEIVDSQRINLVKEEENHWIESKYLIEGMTCS